MKTGETHFCQLMKKVGYTLSEEEKKVEEKVIYLICCYSYDSANKRFEDLFNKGKKKDYYGQNVDDDAGFSNLEEAKKVYEDIIKKCLHERDTEMAQKLDNMELVEYFPERSVLYFFQMKEFSRLFEVDSKIVFEERDWIREEKPFRNFTIDKKTGNVTESEWSENFLRK